MIPILVVGHQDCEAKNLLFIFTDVIFISCKNLFIYKDHTKTGGFGNGRDVVGTPTYISLCYLNQVGWVSTGRSHYKSLLVLC